MTARLFALPAMMIGLFAVVPSPVRSELPEAPAPRAKKATAEMLVGKWKATKLWDMQVPPELEIIKEFTPDGKYRINRRDPKTVHGSKGTYVLLGETLRLVNDVEIPQGKSRDVIIESLTDQELIVLYISGNYRERNTYKKLEK
jgi:uncharacterized protein (TIGR03066 family)